MHDLNVPALSIDTPRTKQFSVVAEVYYHTNVGTKERGYFLEQRTSPDRSSSRGNDPLPDQLVIMKRMETMEQRMNNRVNRIKNRLQALEQQRPVGNAGVSKRCLVSEASQPPKSRGRRLPCLISNHNLHQRLSAITSIAAVVPSITEASTNNHHPLLPWLSSRRAEVACASLYRMLQVRT